LFAAATGNKTDPPTKTTNDDNQNKTRHLWSALGMDSTSAFIQKEIAAAAEEATAGAPTLIEKD